jgi:hypothetical protein
MLPVPFEEDVFKVPSIYNFAVLNTLVGLPMPFLSCRNANLCLAGGDITSAQSHSTFIQNLKIQRAALGFASGPPFSGRSVFQIISSINTSV